MEGEQPTIAESEQAVPAIGAEQEVETEETEKPVDLQQPEGQAETEPEEDDGLDELDFGFKKYRVPKELKQDVENWRAATTKKEQSVAEQQKALETQRLKQAEASDAELDARANLRTVNSELERFKSFDWNAYQQLKQTDYVAAEEAWNYVQHLKGQKADLEGTIGKATQERTQAAQQDLAKRVEQTTSEATKIIPGLKAEAVAGKINELVSFAQSEGIPEQVLKDMWSPTLLKLLHRAQVGHLAMQKQATAAPKPAVQQPTLVPLEKVAGKSTPGASKSIGDLAKSGDMDAYVAARKAGRVR
ncbi:MAG: hypothetical protein ACTHN2_01630 [Nitrobacter sp.]